VTITSIIQRRSSPTIHGRQAPPPPQLTAGQRFLFNQRPFLRKRK
jgi:hypothetical protein